MTTKEMQIAHSDFMGKAGRYREFVIDLKEAINALNLNGSFLLAVKACTRLMEEFATK